MSCPICYENVALKRYCYQCDNLLCIYCIQSLKVLKCPFCNTEEYCNVITCGIKAIRHKNYKILDKWLFYNDVNQLTYGTTVLIEAIKIQDEKAVQMIIQHPKIDLNQADRFGNTPFLWACVKNYGTIAKMLWKAGHINIYAENHHGGTAFSLAYQTNSWRIFQEIPKFQKDLQHLNRIKRHFPQLLNNKN